MSDNAGQHAETDSSPGGVGPADIQEAINKARPNSESSKALGGDWAHERSNHLDLCQAILDRHQMKHDYGAMGVEPYDYCQACGVLAWPCPDILDVVISLRQMGKL